MAKTVKPRLELNLIPMLSNESLYVGIDIGKQEHVAGFVSTTLLKRHERFEACPVLKFEQSREGFRLLEDRVRSTSRLSSALCCWKKPATNLRSKTTNDSSDNRERTCERKSCQKQMSSSTGFPD